VYHPSGETALPCYQIKIVARVLVFIKNYQAQVSGVVILITLLAGFVPLLQVTFFTLLGDFYLVDSLQKIGTKLEDHRLDSYQSFSFLYT
jgi:hypothetical protein